MRWTHTSLFFFFNDTATTEIYTLSLHDALPIWKLPEAQRDEGGQQRERGQRQGAQPAQPAGDDHGRGAQLQRDHQDRSEEHTSELQSPCNLVCRLLLEKNNAKMVMGL